MYGSTRSLYFHWLFSLSYNKTNSVLIIATVSTGLSILIARFIARQGGGGGRGGEGLFIIQKYLQVQELYIVTKNGRGAYV